MNRRFFKVLKLHLLSCWKTEKKQKTQKLENMKNLPKKPWQCRQFGAIFFLRQIKFYIVYDSFNLLCSNGSVRQKQKILYCKFDWKSKVLRQNSQTRELFLRIIQKIVWNRAVILSEKPFLSSKLQYCHWWFFDKRPEKSWRWEYTFDSKMKAWPKKF